MNELTFLGAAGTVTGSRYLLQQDEKCYLIDCGLFQGGRRLKSLNWEPFPKNPKNIDAVFLTHAHIDHSGYLPRLVKEGFGGRIYASESTCGLLEILMPDAAYLQEQDAKYANKHGYSRHKPAIPLFDSKDAQEVLARLHPVPFNHPIEIETINVTWRPAGHILGSAIIEIILEDHPNKLKIVFSGDLGRSNDEIMKPPTKIGSADMLLVESTYGKRSRKEEDIAKGLAELVDHVEKNKGILLIPAFAVGRTQTILYHLRKLQESGRAAGLPVFIDSPMAVDVSSLYCQFGSDHNLDINLLMDDRACPLRCKITHFVKNVEDSKALNFRNGPAVIISASGMCTGGRVLHHLKHRLMDKRNVVLLVGYQAEGGRGRLLLDGAQSVKIHGESIPVRARIEQLHALSAHADQGELINWLSDFKNPPAKTFIVHGERDSSLELKKVIRRQLGWEAIIPQRGASYKL